MTTLADEGRTAFLSDTLALPLLGEMIPGGLRFGASYLVEFEPDSLWYETSLTLVAESLKRGTRTDYHTFQHVPHEVRGALASLGVNVKRMEVEETLRIIDSYTVTTGLELSEGSDRDRRFFEARSVSLSDWTKQLLKDMNAEIAEERKRRLHVDDNVLVLVQYNDEKNFIDFWRTKIIPEMRKLEFAGLHGVVRGAYSEAFYKQFESLSDGIVDFKNAEESGRIEQYARVRSIRGRTCDSRWQHLRLLDSGEVSIAASQTTAAFNDKPYYQTTPLMDYLVHAFIEDYMHRRHDLQQSGWRSLPEIARTVKIPQSQVYGDPRYGHTFGGALEPLVQEALVEYRFFSGKGRGGRVLKVRVQYEKEPVRRLVDAAVLKPVRRNP